MVIAMLLAHLVGDYILQWDDLARWKAQSVRGVLVHGIIVTLVTWAFSLPFNPHWWPWVSFICITHVLVDLFMLFFSRWLQPYLNGAVSIGRFLLDQTIHLAVIYVALIGGGYLAPQGVSAALLRELASNRLLTFALAYVFISLPTWILLQFVVFGLVDGTAPDFSRGTNRYVGTLERWLITTFVLLGQFLLVPLVALPRLMFEGRSVLREERPTLYVAELLASVAVAIVIGLCLRIL